MPETSLSTEELLQHMGCGVAMTAAGSDEIIFANDALKTLVRDAEKEVESPRLSPKLEEGQTLAFKDLITLSKGQEKGQVALKNPVLDGYLNTAEETRVKIKPNEMPGGQTVYLIEPYSEEQAISQAHSDFVSVVSHEFRTPLTSIKGFADTMLRYGTQLPPDQQKRFINIIKDQADRLTRMVENLLTASKLGSGKMEMAFRAINLDKMTEKVVENILAKGNQDKNYAGREVDVNIEEDLPEIWADRDKLEQVLTNLIDNAVKYSFPDSVVKVHAHRDSEEEDFVVIQVTNHGVGIPPEHLPQIFTKFSRIDNPLTRQVEGTGLGLYITKSMTDSMGGRISVESIPDEETTFTVAFQTATPERVEMLDESAEGMD